MNKQNILSNNIDFYLKNFEPITLDQMNRFSLMNRIDTKYVMDKNILLNSFEKISKHYKVLEINNIRKNNYQTLYFDTPDFQMYQKHHNGNKNRYKVRIRKYLDSNKTFIEVKFKNNKDKTIKKRVQALDESVKLNKKISTFISNEKNYTTENLKPVLWNKFTRITFVSKTSIERVTLDMNLNFSNPETNTLANIPEIIIAEIKQEAFSGKSDFAKIMQEQSIRQEGFSKYCIGVSLIYPNVKKNNFKEKIRLINKLRRKVA